MAIDILGLVPHQVSRDLRGYSVFFYGEPKSGKTTTAAKFPSSLLLAFEKGYSAIPGVMAQPINSWSEFRQVLRQLKSDAAKAAYATIIIDTADIAYDYVVVKGAIFNFRNDLLPTEFFVKNEDGMKHFEDLGVTGAEPVYTKVWGRIKCGTIANEVKEESAFGESSVRTYERKIREWIITGTAKVPYEFGDEKVLTVEELRTALQNREVMLADVKKRAEEYRAGKDSATATASAPTPTNTAVGAFNF